MYRNLHPSAAAHSRGRRAFTLTELLICLGALTVVAGLLFPVFSVVRKRSQAATCASNLKQIGQAIQMYVDDNTGFYPRIWAYPVPNSLCSKWVERVYPYVRKKEIFECPAAPDWITYELGCPPDVPNPEDPNRAVNFDGAYDLNSPLPDNYCEMMPTGQWHQGWSDKAIHQTHYRHPSSTILVLDGDGYWVNPSHMNPPYEGTEALKQCGVDAPHNNDANVCFVDGHVKWLSLQSMTKRSLWIPGESE